MSKIIASYSAKEALEMMKEQFPINYQEKINVAKALIQRLKKTYKKETYTEAYQKYISYGCREESGIMMLCALQQLIDEEKNSVQGINKQIDQILIQQEANETSININPLDKRALREFYKRKLNDLNDKLNEMANAIEVVDFEIVFVPNLFSQVQSA